MRYLVLAFVLILGLWAGGVWAAGGTSGASEIEITATGQAAVEDGDIAKATDEATNAAKRNAVEAGVGVFVKSETVGEDYDIVKQTILTRSEGFISTWEAVDGYPKTEKIEGYILLTMKIKAKVKLISLIGALQDIEEIYDQMERPKVMVAFSEEIGGKPVTKTPSSSVAIMRALADTKFDLVDQEVVTKLIQNEANRAKIRGDAKAAALLAMDQGAEILLLGSADAAQQDLSGVDGTEGFQSANALLTARMVYADTGDVIFTYKQTEGKGITTSSFQQAAMKALDDAGTKLVAGNEKEFAARVLAEWARQVVSGRIVRVVAEGVEYQDMQALKKALGKFRGHVKIIGKEKFEGNQGTISIKTLLNGEEFRDRLADVKIGKRNVKIKAAMGNVTRISLK